MRTIHTKRFGMAGLLVLSILFIGGCSGDGAYDDYYWGPDTSRYPQYKDLSLVLRVVDTAGRPVQGASVWVGGRLDSRRTEGRLRPLGDGYPVAWQGWLANWVSENYRAVIHRPGGRDEFQIRVTKVGYIADVTTVVIEDYEPNHIFVRDVMVLRTGSGIYSQETGEPRKAEVIPVVPGQPVPEFDGTRILIDNGTATGTPN